MNDAAQRGQVGTPGALAERDAQVFRAGIHLNRLNNEFEDFLFGRIDLLRGKDGKKGADGAFTSVEPADGAVRDDNTAEIAETLHIGRIGVLDARLRAAGHRLAGARRGAVLPLHPGRPRPGRPPPGDPLQGPQGPRRRGRPDAPGADRHARRPELPVVGDGALMAALGQARSHTMRDIVASASRPSRTW